MLIDNGQVIVEQHYILATFNDHYITIVERLSGKNLAIMFRAIIY